MGGRQARADISRWREWLTLGASGSPAGPVTDAVMRLRVDRDRWDRLLTWVGDNEDIPDRAATIGWLWYDHAVRTSIRLRRLADEDKRSASLGRLLVEVSEQASQFTRVRYRALWRYAVVGSTHWHDVHRQLADHAFDELAGEGQPALPCSVVDTDLASLRNAVADAKYFVDKRIAHHNPDHDPVLTLQQVHTATDTLTELHRKYCLLILQVTPPTARPADDPRWGEAFRVAWRKEPNR